MDKQKQIEEMTELMANWALRNNMCWHEGHAKALAETFVENDYGKIPENAVVLTEGAYSDLLSDEVDTIERDIAEYWATQDVKSVAKELHKDGYRKLDDHAIFVLRKAKGLEEKVRKETAEKFAERVKMAFYYEFDELIPSIMADKIDEICKEITEGKV